MMNYANYDYGVRLVDYSSEMMDCEANNVLDNKMNTIWLSDEALPQWLCLSLVNLHNVRNVVLRTIGWHCWHPYSTNPKVVVLHVSADGSKFKQWDTFYASGPQKGSQLFCCAPISCALYPFLAFEITEVFGGNQTYLNRLYLYSEEITSSPAVSDTSQRSTEQISLISSPQHDSIETNSVLLKLEAALGLNDTSSLSDDQPTHSVPQPSTIAHQPLDRHNEVDDDFSDVDSDSLPLTLTLGDRKIERGSERNSISRIIGPPAPERISISRASGQDLNPLVEGKGITQSKIESGSQNRFAENPSTQPTAPGAERIIVIESKDIELAAAPRHDAEAKLSLESSTLSESHIERPDSTHKGSESGEEPKSPPHPKQKLEGIELPHERYEVSSLTISRDDISFQKSRDVSIRISDLEGKMDSLMKAFELLRSPERADNQNSSKTGRILSDVALDPAMGKSADNRRPTTAFRQEAIARDEDNYRKESFSCTAQVVLESENEESDTADTLSLTSNLSNKSAKSDLTKREQEVASTPRETSNEVNTSTPSLNRSSTTMEAIHVVKSLESLLRTILPTHTTQLRTGTVDKHKTAEPMPHGRLDCPTRTGREQGESIGDTIHPQPSRASPLQPASCLVTSHSPLKGPGGVFRREKIQFPDHSHSVSIVSSPSCSCGFTSLPTRVNPIHLDHPTPLLPPNLNLPSPLTHTRTSLHRVQEEPKGIPHSSVGVGRLKSQHRVDQEQSESIDELVEKLHQKILERTLKEAELALIRKTKRELHNEKQTTARISDRERHKHDLI
jgi:hypothetical protein